jgi:FeS assembly SUF system protein
MSSPQNSEPAVNNDRIIPLDDAPTPDAANPDAALTAGPAAQSPTAATAGFVPDPLSALKFRPVIIEALSKVFDPEIPVNIYELGLVYDIDVDSAANVRIRMTLTAPACPAAQTIPLDVERQIKEIAGVKDVKVDIVWDPPWTRDRMSEAAKLQLGML